MQAPDPTRRGKIWSRMQAPEAHQKKEDLVPNAGTRDPPEEERSGPECRLQPEDTVVVEGNVTIFTLGSWFDGDVDWRILISPKINQRLLTPRRYYTEWRKEISRISLPVEIWGIPPPSRQMLDRIKCLSATRRDSLEIPLSESFSLRGISLPESHSRLDKYLDLALTALFAINPPSHIHTPQPRLDEIDISLPPSPLTSDRQD